MSNKPIARTSGALRWSKIYNGPANATDRAQAVAVGPDGNIHVTGLCECPAGTVRCGYPATAAGEVQPPEMRSP